MRVLFRCDASAEIGGGHVMRCLTLAHELGARGADCTLACTEETPTIVPALKSGEFPVMILADAMDPASITSTEERWDVAVVDHYGLSQDYERALRETSKRILVVDDLANRKHDCDWLLDQTFGRDPADYEELVPPGSSLLTGSEYCLVRPEFAKARPASLAAKSADGPLRRLFVSLGLTDIGGITAEAVEGALHAGLDAQIDVVVGQSAESLPRLCEIGAEHANVVIHIAPENICELMAAADIAIGAAGTSSWERCCLGLPTIMLCIADNQRMTAQILEKTGAVMATSSDTTAIAKALRRLAGASAVRMTMSRAAAAVTDGAGAQRVADILMSAPGLVTARRATKSDSHTVWIWRNDEQARAASLDASEIPLAMHDAWWSRQLKNSADDMFICEIDGTSAAHVRFELNNEANWRVSIVSDPRVRGRGLGSTILAACIAMFEKSRPNARLVAEIREENVASHKIFCANGFKNMSNQEGVNRYIRDIGTGK